MTAPVLASNTLAQVSINRGFAYTVEYRGGVLTMADGTTVIDLVNDSAKKTFILTWKNITSTERDTINTAWNAIRKASGNFTAPDGQTATVMRDPNQKQLKWDSEMKAGGTLLWSTTMTLVEV